MHKTYNIHVGNIKMKQKKNEIQNNIEMKRINVEEWINKRSNYALW